MTVVILGLLLAVNKVAGRSQVTSLTTYGHDQKADRILIWFVDIQLLTGSCHLQLEFGRRESSAPITQLLYTNTTVIVFVSADHWVSFILIDDGFTSLDDVIDIELYHGTCIFSQ